MTRQTDFLKDRKISVEIVSPSNLEFFLCVNQLLSKKNTPVSRQKGRRKEEKKGRKERRK
jgi:hypothetical protein